jgi:hypothetical protein
MIRACVRVCADVVSVLTYDGKNIVVCRREAGAFRGTTV